MSAMPGEPRPSAASKPHAASLVPHSLHRQRAPGTTASLVGQRCAGLSPVQRTGSVKSLLVLGGLCPGLGFRYAHGSLSPRIQRTELLWMRLLVKGALLRQRRGYEQTLRLRSFALWRLKPPECRIRSASAESSHRSRADQSRCRSPAARSFQPRSKWCPIRQMHQERCLADSSNREWHRRPWLSALRWDAGSSPSDCRQNC